MAEIKKAPIANLISGTFVAIIGIFIGVAIIMFSPLLAIIGIPIILVCVFLPIYAAIAGAKTTCPNCGKDVYFMTSKKPKFTTCTGCKKRLKIFDNTVTVI